MTDQELQHPHENARLSALHSLQILGTPIEERFERITRLASKAFDIPICAITCVDEHQVWAKSAQGLNAYKMDRSATFCQHTILGDGPLVINDARFDERFADNPLGHEDSSLVFYAGMPIRSIGGLPVAAFCMIDSEPRSFDNDDLEMLEDFAKLAQYELHNAGPNRVQDDLIHQVGYSWRLSMIDPLTRLWNHDGIITTLSESLERSSESNASMFIVMVDLARFRDINTALGNAGGDEILRAFAKALIREVGEEHIVGRNHNDQFMIQMNTVTDIAGSQRQLDRIQQFVDSYPIAGIEGRVSMGGALAGVLVDRGCPFTTEGVFEHLDESIYLAKQSDEYQLVVIQRNSGDQQAA